MRSGNFGPEPTPASPARVVIVCLRASSARVRAIISQHAMRDWEREGSIRIVEITGRGDTRENSRLIRRIAPPGSTAWILLLERIQHTERFGELGDQLRVGVKINSVVGLRDKLQPILRQCRLDWRSQAAGKLAAWHHHEITLAHIDAWLQQFERMQERWLGERLLRALDFWPPIRLRDAAALDNDLALNFDCLCLNTVRQGKSASFLSNLFAKAIRAKFPKFLIEDFRTLFADPARLAEHQRVLFIEDCLLTGTEMTNFLSALLGIPHPKGRKSAYVALPDASALRAVEVELRFIVASDVGLSRLNRFLIDHDLPNMLVKVDPAGIRNVLTAEGKSALEADRLYETDPKLNNCMRDSDKNIARAALAGLWKNDAQLGRATDFLRGVGDQLFRNYLVRAKFDTWDERKIAPCAFGMHGFGMMLAFAHSVPKASLPLFWIDGPVSFPGGTIQWRPLFPNAAF